jgi:hypothetical protein
VGFWSKIKAAVRGVVRVVIEVVNRVTLGVLDLLLGFFAWPPKRLRLHIFVLWNVPPPVIEGTPVPVEQVVQDAIDHTKRIYKKLFNVNVLPYRPILHPGHQRSGSGRGAGCHLRCRDRVLRRRGVLRETAGRLESHTHKLHVSDHRVCGARPPGDRFRLLHERVRRLHHRRLLETDHLTLPHEIGHSCGLSPGPYWHDWTPSNLMYKSSPAGENAKWFQKIFYAPPDMFNIGESCFATHPDMPKVACLN